MSQFFDEIVVFGASLDACLSSMEIYASEVWASVDDAMEMLWESEFERSAAKDSFSVDSLVTYTAEIEDDCILLGIDAEADAAAEKLSSLLSVPTVAIEVLEHKWCKLVAFDEGRRLGWFFWVGNDPDLSEGEVVAAPVKAAVDNGGWIGDTCVFEAFAPEDSDTTFSEILKQDWKDPFEFAYAFKAMLGFEVESAAAPAARSTETENRIGD